MSAAEFPEFVTVEHYLESEDSTQAKCEYVDGWVRAMTGATVRHNKVKMKCLQILLNALEDKPCQPYDSDMKIRIRNQGRTRFYYPDIQVVCDSNADTELYQDQPVLIIEVLSPSTRRYDLDEKMSAYLDIPSLEYYVILEQHQPHAIVMRRTPLGFLREVYEGMEASISLPALGCHLALKDVYKGVELTPTCVQEEETEYEPTP